MGYLLKLARSIVPDRPPEVSHQIFLSEEALFRLVMEVFPEAQVIGPDNTDWEAHRRRIRALEKLGCWICRGLQFWTWPGGDTRCARCHPPAEPDKVIWLEERVRPNGAA